MRTDLSETILSIARAAAPGHSLDTAVLQREIQFLRGRVAVLSQTVSDLQRENLLLRKGVIPASGGDSR
jgi:hypothetical protein